MLLGNGNGTFQAALDFGAGSGLVSVAAGDFNGDGLQDLAVVNIDFNNVSVLLNNTPSGHVRRLSPLPRSRANK